MKYDEFMRIVLKMRNAQRNYFKTRDHEWLSIAKETEKQVDQVLKMDPRQGKLFDAKDDDQL